MKIIPVAGLCLVALLPCGLRADWDYHRHSEHGPRDRDRGWSGPDRGFGFFWAGVAIGSLFQAPPPRCTRVVVAGTPYEYYDGVYYRPCPDGYVVVNPPMGALVPVVPSGGVRILVGHRAYHRCGNVWYLEQPTGYLVVPPPVVESPAVVAAPVPVADTRSGFDQVGHDWAKDLRNEVATFDQFVDYVRANLLRADTRSFASFREAFIAAYGVNGRAAFERAVDRAHQ